MDLLRITYILLLLSLLSCKKDDEDIRKTSALGAFHTIVLDDSFEVELLEQDNYEIEISGAKSFVDQTKFSVQDCTLTLKNEKKFKWTDPADNTLKLLIKGKGLKAVHANESCIIRSLNTITTREFGIVLKSKANTADIEVDNEVCYYWNNFPCGGKLTLRGKTQELKLWNYAIMSVDASSLKAKIGTIENYSKGDCQVNISDSLVYKINGEGNIILYGNAAVSDKGSASSGRLIRR